MTEGPEYSGIVSVFVRHRAKLAARLAKYLLRPEDVEDILQETFIQSYRASENTEIRSPQAYLYIVARNLVLKHLKKSSREMLQEVSDIEDNDLTLDQPSVDDEVHYRQAMLSFVKAAQSLPPQCRKVLLLRKIYGMSHNEISQSLGISKSTVERHITNGLKRCYAEIARQGYGFDDGRVTTIPSKKSLVHNEGLL